MQSSPERQDRSSVWRRLLRRLRPIDKRLFPLFDMHAALCVEGLQTLTALLQDIADADGRVLRIEAIEKRADGLVHDVRQVLRHALFAPFAPEALQELIVRLDDVLDITEDAAQSLHLYHVTAVTPEAVKLAELAVESCTLLRTAIGGLARLENPRAIISLCGEIDRLEAQADHVMRAAMSRLFREEPDAHQLIKLKAVYELLEQLTDKCKHVANDIQLLVLRYA
jgi:hypothetical protein